MDEDFYAAEFDGKLPLLSQSPPTSSSLAAPTLSSLAAPISRPEDPCTIPPSAGHPPTNSNLANISPSPLESLHSARQSQSLQTPKTERNASSKVRKPSKPADATAGKSTLFWVNTDLQSAAGGNKEETLKRIRSHVMSEHNRKKRLEGTKRYKSKSYNHMAFQSPETPSSAFRPPRTSSLSAASPSSPSSNSRHSSLVSETFSVSQELVPTSKGVDYFGSAPAEWCDETWDDGDDDRVVEISARSTTPSLFSYVGTGAHDPFNTGHTQLTDRMMRHLQNCKRPLHRRYTDH